MKNLKNERGASLIIAVVVLVALTLIGLAAVTTTSLSNDAARNISTKSMAYHMAEACMYAQIERIQRFGGNTCGVTCAPGNSNALGNNNNYPTCSPATTCDMKNGLSCTATAPTLVGGTGSSAGVLVGYSLESGSSSIGMIPYSFSVTGTGPRGITSSMVVTINLPAAGGGYGS